MTSVSVTCAYLANEKETAMLSVDSIDGSRADAPTQEHIAALHLCTKPTYCFERGTASIQKVLVCLILALQLIVQASPK